jgi:hypothetical protein
VEIAAEMSPEASQFLDKGIYNPNHMLRTLYSYKFGKNRIKEIDLSFNYHDTKIEVAEKETELEWFCASLITWAFEAKKIHVPIPIPEVMPSLEVTSKTINDAVKLLHKIDKEGIWEPELDRVSGPVVPLMRAKDDNGEKKANYCWICKDEKGKPKLHQSENAYLLVFEKDVIFRCHRGEKENFSLGRVKFELINDEESDEEIEEEKSSLISNADLNRIRASLTGDRRMVAGYQ